MIHVFKLINGFFDPTLPSLFEENTRESKGHNKKIKVKTAGKDIRKYNFSVRTIAIWNSLSQECVDAETIVQFEKALDNHWSDQDVLYDDFKAPINIITNNRYRDYKC